MKISEIMALNHICTKKQARKYLNKNKIIYNNHIVNEDIDINQGTLIFNKQEVDINPLKYYLLNKPKGYICANKDNFYPCVTELLPRNDLHIVGRLDRDTTGLLLLTNDLKLRKFLTLPESHIEKTYAYTCINPVSLKDIELVKKGIIIDGSKECLPAYMTYSNYAGTIVLYEGKYHEVKKIFLSLNNKITSLKRISFADISLDIEEGCYRELTIDEIKYLRGLYNDKKH